MSDQIDNILNLLKSKGNSKSYNSMIRFGIKVDKAFGVSIPQIRSIAKDIGKDHQLASELWNSEIHEARLLACLVDDPKYVSEEQMESWVRDFRSWDLCDHCCNNLFSKTAYAYDKAMEWSKNDEEYIKRAGFVLIACLAIHDKNAPDKFFIDFLPRIIEESTDERNFVKKSVNWCLRQIGKRNIKLNKIALDTANTILEINCNSSKWIAKDAIKELSSAKIQNRVLNKK